MIETMIEQAKSIADLGGPVVILLLTLSVISVTLTLFKIVQYVSLGVGRHKNAEKALSVWVSGNFGQAIGIMSKSRSVLGKTAYMAMQKANQSRFEQIDTEQLIYQLQTEAENKLNMLERGFRLLDSIAQIAPLLGLFGTVLGMIEAFQKLQNAGNSVDPSILAGGIWVALLTTAVGLAVAMPTSLFLTYFESRVARERQACEVAISRIMQKPIASTTNQNEAGLTPTPQEFAIS